MTSSGAVNVENHEHNCTMASSAGLRGENGKVVLNHRG